MWKPGGSFIRLTPKQWLFRRSTQDIRHHGNARETDNTTTIKKKSDGCLTVALCWHYLSSRAVASQVLWAGTSLTTVFGMGTGGPST